MGPRAGPRAAAANGYRADEDSAESRYKLEPKDEVSADKIYERRWALTLLDQVLAKLRGEFERDGKLEQFET